MVAVKTLQMYNRCANSWVTGTSMPTARAAPAAGVICGKLYVVGGDDSVGDPTDVLEIYNPMTNIWTTGTSMPTARDSLAAGVICGILYAVGGEI